MDSAARTDVVDVPTTVALPIGLVGAICLTLPPTGAETAAVTGDRVLAGATARVAFAAVDPVDSADPEAALVVFPGLAEVSAALVLPVGLVPVVEADAGVATPESVPATPGLEAEETAGSTAEVAGDTDATEPPEAAPVGGELHPAVRTAAAASATQR